MPGQINDGKLLGHDSAPFPLPPQPSARSRLKAALRRQVRAGARGPAGCRGPCFAASRTRSVDTSPPDDLAFQALTMAFAATSAATLVGAVPQRSSAPPHRISQRHRLGMTEYTESWYTAAALLFDPEPRGLPFVV